MTQKYYDTSVTKQATFTVTLIDACANGSASAPTTTDSDLENYFYGSKSYVFIGATAPCSYTTEMYPDDSVTNAVSW